MATSSHFAEQKSEGQKALITKERAQQVPLKEHMVEGCCRQNDNAAEESEEWSLPAGGPLEVGEVCWGGGRARDERMQQERIQMEKRKMQVSERPTFHSLPAPLALAPLLTFYLWQAMHFWQVVGGGLDSNIQRWWKSGQTGHKTAGIIMPFYKFMILPHLEYSVPFWSPLSLKGYHTAGERTERDN